MIYVFLHMLQMAHGDGPHEHWGYGPHIYICVLLPGVVKLSD